MNNKKQGLDPRFAALILVLAVVASGVAILLFRKGDEQAPGAALLLFTSSRPRETEKYRMPKFAF